jgi:poly(3-hydroxybutyrate) depolymerase
MSGPLRPIGLLLGVSCFGALLPTLGCRWDGDPPDDTHPSADTDTDVDADTDADADTDTDTDADTDTDTDTDSGTATEIPWIYERDRDTTTYSNFGLEVVTYAVTASNPTGYTDPDGDAPLFYVLKPTDLDDSAHPVLMWLHGSAQGIEDDDAYSDKCGADGIEAVVSDAVTDHHYIAGEIAARDWIWVVPVNSWCDLWSGAGDRDPIDPSHHGLEHVETILDALQTGFGGLQADPTAIYGWGTSIGGAGIVTISADYGQFAAVIADSGPVQTTSWYNLPSETPYLDHIAGGSPTEQPAEYARMDGPLLVSTEGYRVPIFTMYNTYDELVPIAQNTAFSAALDAAYPADGVRYFHHDVDHHAPVVKFHVQTGYERSPFGYTNRAAFSFLEGSTVDFFEAEDTCTAGTCTVESESGSGTTEPSSIFSKGSAIVADSTQSAGVMYSATLPASVPRGVPLTLLPVVAGEDMSTEPPSEAIVTLAIKQGDTTLEELVITRGDLAAGDAEQHTAYYNQVVNTSWTLSDSLPAGDLTIQAYYQGHGKVWLDGFWVIQ